MLKTFSDVLCQALAGVYEDLGLGLVGDEVFWNLVIARVMEPTSLFDTDWVLRYGRISASHSMRKRTLKRCQEDVYREVVATACFTYASTLGDVSLCLYDVTTLYFLD